MRKRRRCSSKLRGSRQSGKEEVLDRGKVERLGFEDPGGRTRSSIWTEIETGKKEWW